MNPTLPSPVHTTQTRSPLTRFGWAIADAWIITRRDLMHWRLRFQQEKKEDACSKRRDQREMALMPILCNTS